MKQFYCEMQERDKSSFLDFFLTFEASLILTKDSDLDDLLLKKFSLLKLEDDDVECSKRSMSLSVWELLNDFSKTSRIKSGWLFSNDKVEVLCFLKVFSLHALACGKEFGRTAKELWFGYVPPERSSKNSSSSDELILSSANEDWRDSDCDYVVEEKRNIKVNDSIHFTTLTYLIHAPSGWWTFIP